MKRLALVLLVLNLALLAWYSTRPASAPPPEPPLPEAQRLMLLRELPGEQLAPRPALVEGELPAGVVSPGIGEQPVAEAPPPATPSSPVASCYVADGFTDERGALRGKAALEKAGAKVEQPVSEAVERTRYWVLLPPLASQAQARKVIERLKKAGVRDYYLIPSGENRNALSLGVFSTREAARRRMNDVASLRLKVRVEEVRFPAKRFALQLEWPAAPRPDWREVLPSGIEVRPRPCGG